MNEPAWIDHDGSAVCPVPAGHDVEVRFLKGAARDRDAPNWNWHRRCPNPITHYRDWTAFKQQEAMGKDVPEWIVRRRNELLNGADPHRDDYRSDYAAIVSNAVEAFIAAHEQPPVDWLAGVMEQALDAWREAQPKMSADGFMMWEDFMAAELRNRIPNIDSLAAAGEGE